MIAGIVPNFTMSTRDLPTGRVRNSDNSTDSKCVVLRWSSWWLVLWVALGARGVCADGAIDSLPWAVVDSDVIVRGVATRIATTQPTNSTLSTITLTVHETLKGEHSPTIMFIAQTSYTHDWRKGERLYFLVRTPRYLQTMTATPAEAPVFASVPLVLRPTGATSHTRLPVVLDDKAVFHDLELREIKGRDDVLAAIRAEVRRPPSPRRESVELKIMPGLDAGGSNLIDPRLLNIPVDERALPRARNWITSDDPYNRRNAVVILSYFESDESAALLRRLLDDPFLTDRIWPWRPIHLTSRDDPFMEIFASWTADPKLREMKPTAGYGKWGGAYYPLRRDAWEMLRRWKRDPGDAVIKQPPYPANYPSPVTLGVVAILGPLVVAGILVLRSWQHRRDTTPRLLIGVPGFCLILLFGVVALWVRSNKRIDDLAWRTASGSQWELASMSGKLRLIRLEDWLDPSPMALTSVPNDAEHQAAWSIDQAIKTAPRTMTPGPPITPVAVHFAGFEYRRDAFPARVWHRSAISAWTLPLWAVAVILVLPPAARLFGVMRYHRRVRRGLCAGCGYDLRHTPQRCPECGRDVCKSVLTDQTAR